MDLRSKFFKDQVAHFILPKYSEDICDISCNTTALFEYLKSHYSCFNGRFLDKA